MSSNRYRSAGRNGKIGPYQDPSLRTRRGHPPPSRLRPAVVETHNMKTVLPQYPPRTAVTAPLPLTFSKIRIEFIFIGGWGRHAPLDWNSYCVYELAHNTLLFLFVFFTNNCCFRIKVAMYESTYGTNKPSWFSVSQIYVLYPCNYDNEMILTLILALRKGFCK